MTKLNCDMGESFGIEIIDQNTSEVNGSISGSLTIKFPNA